MGVEVGGATPAENLRRLRELCLVATGGLWPDQVILLDLDPGIGLTRLRAGKVAGQNSMFDDRIESRELAFHRRVRDGFLACAKAEPDVVKVIDAGAPPGDVTAAMEGFLRGFLGL